MFNFKLKEMKRKVNLALVAFVMTFMGYGVCNSQNNYLQNSDLFNANVEALASGDDNTDDEDGSEAGDGGSGGELVVKCFCKTNWFSPNICTVGGSGGYCGGDPCANHDSNCRWLWKESYNFV